MPTGSDAPRGSDRPREAMLQRTTVSAANGGFATSLASCRRAPEPQRRIMGSLHGSGWFCCRCSSRRSCSGLTATSVTVILPQLKRHCPPPGPDFPGADLQSRRHGHCRAAHRLACRHARLAHLMVFAVIGFTVASMLCGLVDLLEAMLALRVAQGAFGAPIFPMGQTILLASFHRSQHPSSSCGASVA